MRGGACALGASCAGPSLTIGAGSRNSLPTPRSIALSVAYRPVSRFVTSFNNYGQNVRGPPSPPQSTLRDFLASALPHGNPPVPSPPTLSMLSPLAPSGPVQEERGGRRRFKPISSELVRHMSAGVHFSRFATPEMLCAWLGPYTHAIRSRRSGRSMPSPTLCHGHWPGLVDAVDAPISCQADHFWPPLCLPP